MWDDVFVSTEEKGRAVASAFKLHQNYPNPFNPSTNIRFELPETAQVNISVFDMQGRIVAQVFNGSKTSGAHDLSFDAAKLASGIYFYRIQATTASGKAFAQTRKMVLLK
jgi:hypothetical protein